MIVSSTSLLKFQKGVIFSCRCQHGAISNQKGERVVCLSRSCTSSCQDRRQKQFKLQCSLLKINTDLTVKLFLTFGFDGFAIVWKFHDCITFFLAVVWQSSHVTQATSQAGTLSERFQWLYHQKCVKWKLLSFKMLHMVSGAMPWFEGHGSNNFFVLLRALAPQILTLGVQAEKCVSTLGLRIYHPHHAKTWRNHASSAPQTT